MGQIIIDLPVRVTRHYKIDDVKSANELLEVLQNTAQRVEDAPDNLTVEDLPDIRAAKRARKGDVVAWEEAKTYLQTLE